MNRKKFFFLPLIVLFGVLAVCEFVYHRFVPFMMDDLWYATNLATGEPLSGFCDVIKGQVWHYLNWGGRSITHTILQFVIMGGELFSDIVNILMTVLLCAVIASFARTKSFKVFSFLASFSMIVCFNASIMYSMFWQAGVANYVYSSVWILLFIRIYTRVFDDENPKTYKCINFWIVPLALITGWSNENMGPACFVLSVLAILSGIKFKKFKTPPLWMLLGSLFSLLGSCLVILAPGNFKRSEFTGDGSLFTVIKDRLLSMLTGLSSYLLPVVILVTLVISVTVLFARIKLSYGDVLILVTAVLSYGAMILSPHFPARASFGIMILLIVSLLSCIEKLCTVFGKFYRVAFWFTVATYVYSITEIFISVISCI